MANNGLGISVLIATYNRAEVLAQTLEALTQMDRANLDCSFVVVDNNSSDLTPEVIRQFAGRLPLIALKEPKPGKNCALNKAINECTLKEIVVFADDDISPRGDWLQAIARSVKNHPNCNIFGGAIEVSWPASGRPSWLSANWIEVFAVGLHRYASAETVYVPPACPFGANFWVRKSILGKRAELDETIGPHPTNRIMGSETSLLMRLQDLGEEIWFCPDALVYHRVTENQYRPGVLRKRGYGFGRGQVRLHGCHRRQLLKRSRALWAIRMLVDYAYTAVRLLWGRLWLDRRSRFETSIAAMIRLGKLNETVKQVFFQPKHGSGAFDGKLAAIQVDQRASLSAAPVAVRHRH